MPPLTMHLGPDEVLLNLKVEFRDGISAGEVVETIGRLERAIRQKHPEFSRIFIGAATFADGDPPAG